MMKAVTGLFSSHKYSWQGNVQNNRIFIILPNRISLNYETQFKTRFHIDTKKSLCDWLALSDSIFDWLRAAFA